jgi:hypothetical protein
MNLQMAVKVVNNTIRLDGLVPILLIFGVYLWIIVSDLSVLLIS